MDESVLNKINVFSSQFKHQTFKKREILLRADDNPQGIFFLTSGTVKQYAISKKGEELVVNLYKPPAFFPMTYLFAQVDNAYYFEATSDVEINKVPLKETEDFLKNNPDVLFDLTQRVFKGIDGLLTRMTYLMHGTSYLKLLTELILTAKRFGVSSNGGVILTISEKDLATQTGMSRETVSREIKILKDKGLITLAKNLIFITNMKKLEEELINS